MIPTARIALPVVACLLLGCRAGGMAAGDADAAAPDGADCDSTTDEARETAPEDAADTIQADSTPDTVPQPDGALSGETTVPGDANEADAGPEQPPTPEGSLALNEVQCHGPDWVEVVNLDTVNPADASGFLLTEAPGDAAKTYVFAKGTVVGPGGFLVVQVESGTKTGLQAGIGCGTDTLRLYRPDGSLADQVAIPKCPTGAAWGRLPDATGDWDATQPTKGMPNQAFVDHLSILYDPMKVAVIDLFLPEKSIEDLWQDPYAYVDGRFALSMEGYASGTLDVGIRLKGKIGSYRNLNEKAAFKVRFDFKDKDGRLFGLKKMTLNNMVQDSSMLHEVVSYRILRAFGLPAPRTGYARVRLNHREYGLYLDLESYDDVFLEQWFDSTSHLYEGEYGTDSVPGAASQFEVDEGDEADRADLEALIAVANGAPDQTWASDMAEVADLDEMRKVWAVEVFIGHWDGYAPTVNNYYLHSDDDWRFSMLTGGTDQTFSSFLGYHDGNGYLFKRCMGLAACRQGYDLAMADLLVVVAGLDLDDYVAGLAEFLAPHVEADPRRPYSAEDVANSVAATREFLKARHAEAADVFGCLLGPEPDPDKDGFACASDCDNLDPTVHPGAEDTCADGVDQDCDGTTDNGPACPDWTELWWGSRRYLVCAKPRTWAGARLHCQELGADLAVLDAAEEEAWLRDHAPQLNQTDHWIGLEDQAVEGEFLWCNGLVPGYSNFAPGEPNDWGGNEDCVEMLGGGGWNDMPCDAQLPSLCEDTLQGAGGGGPAVLDAARCEPHCEGAQCGDDGCGGSCGACGEGQTCVGGSCLPGDSCAGHCGGQAPAGCWCDNLCTNYGDCCGDYKAACLANVDSCAGWCGGVSSGGCWCDDICVVYHDCCDDRAALCGGGCSCAGKACGDDGCGTSCGACVAGQVCDASGGCVSEGTGWGCEAVQSPGCGGCPCEACVCALDLYCCYIAWDASCAVTCQTSCIDQSSCAKP